MRTLTTFGPSLYKSRWSGVSLIMSSTSRARGIWRTTRQTDKRASELFLDGEVASILVSYKDAIRECHEETAPVVFRLYHTCISHVYLIIISHGVRTFRRQTLRRQCRMFPVTYNCIKTAFHDTDILAVVTSVGETSERQSR